MNFPITKQNVQHLLLLLMIVLYAIPIFQVVSNLQEEESRSISEIIQKQKQKENSEIADSMAAMGILALVYEMNRPCCRSISSFVSILVLLTGIYGVFEYDESTYNHYAYAGAAFVAIIAFMFCNYQNESVKSKVLVILFGMELCLLLGSVCVLATGALLGLDTKWPLLLYLESLFLGNFALYYIWLHHVETRVRPDAA